MTTNFLLHGYPDLDSLPTDKHHLGWFNRSREIRRRIAEHRGKFDERFVKETNACVSMAYIPHPEDSVPIRTLWHALYYPEIGRAQCDFYLGEAKDPDSPRGLAVKRSGYVTFVLKP